MLHLLMPVMKNWERVLSAWQGYLSESQDFTHERFVLEVKANRAKRADYIWINGVNQLRTIPGKRLFVCHLHFDSAEESGEGLTTIIDAIRREMTGKSACGRFDAALLKAGYDDALALEWDSLRFRQPSVTFYDVLKPGVTTPFPRVTKVDSIESIEDLKYKLRREALEPFVVK